MDWTPIILQAIENSDSTHNMKKLPRDMSLLKSAIDIFMFHVIDTKPKSACRVFNNILSKFSLMTDIEKKEILEHIGTTDLVPESIIQERYLKAIESLRGAVERRYDNNPISHNLYINYDLWEDWY